MQKPTYINECIQNDKLIRWPDKLMPIAVYIAPFRWYKAKHDYNSELKYRQMVIEALNLWAKASGGVFSYIIVQKLHDSQINLDWKRVDRSSLGHCYFNYDSKGQLYSAEVQIGLSDGVIHQKYQNENEVLHTIIHEVGHALGLQHSPFKNDIMYVPHEYGIITASKRDKDTLKWLYRFPCGENVSKVLESYNAKGVRSLDELIFLIENKAYKSKFEEVKDELAKSIKSKDLIEENALIADINLYNISLQNIGLPDEMKEFITKNRMNPKK